MAAALPRGRSRSWSVVLAVASCVTLLALWPASRVRIETDILKILPDLPAAEQYRTFVRTFGGLENVYVAIGVPPEASGGIERAADAAWALCERLGSSPLVDSVRCGPTEQDERFWFGEVLPRAPLLAPPERIPDLLRRLDRAAIRSRIAGERSRLQGPFEPVEAALFSADPLGLADTLEVAPAMTAVTYDPVLDAFVSASRRRVLAVVVPTATELDSTAGVELVATLESAFADVRSEFGADLEFDAIGGPIYAANDASVIRADVTRITSGSMILVVLILGAYFGGLRLPAVLAVAILAAVVWTTALVTLADVRLSVFGLSFAAILIGLGVDYGIHAAARFRRALGGDVGSARAMVLALRETAGAIVASVATTLAAFFVLTFSKLGPVRELGSVVSLGVAAVLLASALIGAPLAVLLVRRDVRSGSPVLWRGLTRSVEMIVDAATARPALTLAAAGVLTLLSGWTARGVEFNDDLGSFRPHSERIERIERIFTEDFSLGLGAVQVVLEAPTLDAALERAARLEHELDERLPGDVLIESPARFLIADKLAADRLARLAPSIDPELPAFVRRELTRNGFRPEAFSDALDVLDALAAGEAPRQIPSASRPDWLDRFVRVYPAGASVLMRVSARAGRAAELPETSVASAIRELAPTAIIASVPLLGAELSQALGGEFRRMLLWSAAAVILVVLLSFGGRPRPALLALTPVSLGCVWLAGLYGACGVSVDPFAITVAPILLGLGIDDGLHAVHGARHHGGTVSSIRAVGGAMTATTLTTCAGFGSLAISRVPALRQAGLLVAVGTVLCLIASLTVIPAAGALLRREPAARPRPPHAPARGRFARLLGRFHITGGFWLRATHVGSRVVPERLRSPAIVALAALGTACLRQIARAINDNLEAVLGPAPPAERRRRSRQTMIEFLWSITERHESLVAGKSFDVRPEDLAVWTALTDSRRGFIVVTAHLGNWEVGSSLPSSIEQRRVHIVREEELESDAREFIGGLLREQMGGLVTTHFAGHDPALALHLREALERGEIVALQADRPRAGGRVVEVELFGRAYPIPVGPLALARASGAPLLPVFMLRDGRRRYRLVFREPVLVPSTGTRERAVRAAADALATHLQWAIREAPHQWYCFAPVFGSTGDRTDHASGT